ncbi:unnamed protein product, partial [Polarella glacialis]
KHSERTQTAAKESSDLRQHLNVEESAARDQKRISDEKASELASLQADEIIHVRELNKIADISRALAEKLDKEKADVEHLREEHASQVRILLEERAAAASAEERASAEVEAYAAAAE